MLNPLLSALPFYAIAALIVLTGQASPLFATPPLAVSSIELYDGAPGTVLTRLRWPGVPGSRYDIERAYDLHTWTTVQPDLDCTQFLMTFDTQPLSVSFPEVFLRIRQTPLP